MARSRRGARKVTGLPPAPPIDWDAIEARELERRGTRQVPGPVRVSRAFEAQTSSRRNTFSRLLLGFNEETLDFLYKTGCRDIYKNYIPGLEVNFRGRSKYPERPIPLNVPAVIVKYGIYVISSRVAKQFVEEIGNEENGSVVRIDAPDMGREFDSDYRINVAVPGLDPEDKETSRLPRLIRESGGLSLSPIIRINDEPTPWAIKHQNQS